MAVSMITRCALSVHHCLKSLFVSSTLVVVGLRKGYNLAIRYLCSASRDPETPAFLLALRVRCN